MESGRRQRHGYKGQTTSRRPVYRLADDCRLATLLVDRFGSVAILHLGIDRYGATIEYCLDEHGGHR